MQGINAGRVAESLAKGHAGRCQQHTSHIPAQRWQHTHQQQRSRHQRSQGHQVVHAVGIKQSEDEIDMKKLEDREQWYIARFCADDAPDWNAAQFIRSEPVAKGLRKLVLEVEISRDKVPIRNGYRHVGQRARIRANSGVEHELLVASAPFPLMRNKDALFKARGDISSGEIKFVKDEICIAAQLELLVPEGEAEDLFKADAGDSWEAGPFAGPGMNLRGPIIGIYNFPTIVIFCEGTGIAAAKALIEATAGSGGLSFPLRKDVRMYYRAPNDACLAFRELWPMWEEKYACKVISATRDTFQDMFDDDDTLEYEPAQTAAIILTGGDEEAELAALEVCKEAEITEIAKESIEQIKTEYLTMGTNI